MTHQGLKHSWRELRDGFGRVQKAFGRSRKERRRLGRHIGKRESKKKKNERLR